MRRNVVAYLALFFALGGIAGAAAQPLLDRPGSVEGSHIESGAVHASDLAKSVREQVQVTTPVNGNYGGQTKDGSATVDAQVAGGQIVDMTVSGKCAWDIDGGGFEANGDTWNYTSSSVGNTFFIASGEFDDQRTLIVAVLEVVEPDVSVFEECAGPFKLVLEGSGS